MTELENQLATALEALGKQYETDMSNLSLQVLELNKRLDESTAQINSLGKRLDDQTTNNEKLAKVLITLNSKLNELAEV